jgi:hypothetical protein
VPVGRILLSSHDSLYCSKKVQKSFVDTDFKELGKHIKQYSSLYLGNASNPEEPARILKYDDFKILLLSTGVPPDCIPYVAGMLNITEDADIEYLDFLSFIPFFVKLHSHIVSNPLNVVVKQEKERMLTEIKAVLEKFFNDFLKE